MFVSSDRHRFVRAKECLGHFPAGGMDPQLTALLAGRFRGPGQNGATEGIGALKVGEVDHDDPAALKDDEVKEKISELDGDLLVEIAFHGNDDDGGSFRRPDAATSPAH